MTSCDKPRHTGKERGNGFHPPEVLYFPSAEAVIITTHPAGAIIQPFLQERVRLNQQKDCYGEHVKLINKKQLTSHMNGRNNFHSHVIAFAFAAVLTTPGSRARSPLCWVLREAGEWKKERTSSWWRLSACWWRNSCCTWASASVKLAFGNRGEGIKASRENWQSTEEGERTKCGEQMLTDWKSRGCRVRGYLHRARSNGWCGKGLGRDRREHLMMEGRKRESMAWSVVC